MKKGIAVPYIIALILGVAVVALIGYWLIALGGKLPWVSQEAYCTARESAWCGYVATNGQAPNKAWTSYAPNCDAIIDYPDCSDYAGGNGGDDGLAVPI